MKVALVRILGNDLPPRHEKGQTIRNLRYILDNEFDFENCDKYYVLNRIVDTGSYEEIRKLVGDRKFEFPFVAEDYLTCDDKLNYLTNVNFCRNATIWELHSKYDVVLPLDGNCFFDKHGFWSFYKTAYNHPYHGYFYIPMSRCKTYNDINFPCCVENWSFGSKSAMDLTEPQLAFVSENFDMDFNPDFPYGRMSKAEFLVRLGIPGVWDNWLPQPTEKSKFYGSVISAGYVHRLPSGVPECETNNILRAKMRDEGIKNLIQLAESIR
jgi:hypothetical protein